MPPLILILPRHATPLFHAFGAPLRSRCRAVALRLRACAYAALFSRFIFRHAAAGGMPLYAAGRLPMPLRQTTPALPF